MIKIAAILLGYCFAIVFMAVNNRPQVTSMIYTFKGKCIGALVVSIVFVLILVRHNMTNFEDAIISETQAESQLSTNIPPFQNSVGIASFDAISSVCYEGKSPESIEDLQKFVFLLRANKNVKICSNQYKLFKQVYGIRVKQTTVKLSDTFLPKVRKWMNGNEELVKATRKQTIIFVDNKWSLESVVFNPVRAKRPGGQGTGSVADYVKRLVEKAKPTCDFCSYEKYTAADDFGLMESERSVAISNTFKIEKYHGMILLKEHDPMHFSQDTFIDAMDLAMKWFERTNRLVPDHKYRHMYFDALPKASASQVHPHIHLALGDYSYYAKWNIMHKAALAFANSVPTWNYWSAVLQVHNALGLSADFGKASIMAYITPQKDLEVVIISQTPSLDFFRLFYFAIRTFIDDLGQFAWSAGFVFPKIGSNTKVSGSELPMMCRLVSRGAADLARADVSSFDLFGTANVNKDPFELIKKLKKALKTFSSTNKLTFKPKYLV